MTTKNCSNKIRGFSLIEIIDARYCAPLYVSMCGIQLDKSLKKKATTAMSTPQYRELNGFTGPLTFFHMYIFDSIEINNLIKLFPRKRYKVSLQFTSNAN